MRIYSRIALDNTNVSQFTFKDKVWVEQRDPEPAAVDRELLVPEGVENGGSPWHAAQHLRQDHSVHLTGNLFDFMCIKGTYEQSRRVPRWRVSACVRWSEKKSASLLGFMLAYLINHILFYITGGVFSLVFCSAQFILI